MRRLAPVLAAGALLAAVATGCGNDATAGSIPESASLAPADAIAFATLVSDDSSEQWQNADALLALVPEARDDLLEEVRTGLAEEGLTWAEDVAPALGPEVVVVATADRKPIILVRPTDKAKLAKLLEEAEDSSATASVAGWTAIAEKQAHLDAYRTALGAGTLETNESFADAMEALPEESLARAWVDTSALAGDIESFFESEEVGIPDFDLGLHAVAAAMSAETDGILVVASIYGQEGATSYKPEAFGSIPADAVLALSFGGTQAVVDRIQDSVDLDEAAAEIEDLTGVSLDSLLSALTGEGALYIRPGGSVPEVTLVLAPPDAGEAFESIDRAVRSVARESDLAVEMLEENGIEKARLEVGEAAVEYALLDGDRVIVTSGERGIADFTGDSGKLVDTQSYQEATERVGIDDRTSGFLYADIDGIVSLVEELSGETLDADVRESVALLDSFVLEVSGEGKTNTVGGFIQVNPR